MDSQEPKTERINQKKRTRIELLRAARQLVEEGGRPSVAEIADRAGISRATAYRYFSTPDDAIREAVLQGVSETIRIADTPGDAPPATAAAARVDRLVADVFRMISDNEGLFRALLGTSAAGETAAPRGGRRIGWLREALAPIEPSLPPEGFERLIQALSLTAGIEAVVVMRDICEADAGEAEAVLRWAARAMIGAALAEAGG